MPAPPPLWSDAFLEQDIREQPEYQAITRDSADFDTFVAAARTALASMQGVREPDERTTIDRVIKPLLAALGWPGTLEALSLTSRDEVDLAIFSEAEEAERLLARPEREQVLGATGIVECKRWGRDFDAAGTGAPAPNRRGESAAQQIQRYLLTAGTDSNESVRWAILTNGARWRLYSYRARPRERTWQIDVNALLVSADIFESVLSEQKLHELRVAWLLLRRESWVPAEGERETLLDRLLALGRRNDAQLADDLSDLIFREVYPEIVTLFWQKQPDATAEAVARASLTFLYRLLFIYYAEDRGMLDTEAPRYRPHSLRYSVRDPVHEQHGKAAFSTVSTNFWQKLKTLRAIIDQGDVSIGQPAYNGGLFASSHAILDEIELSDAELAPIIHQLSHTSAGTYLSYRNLEVQQLGSVYERLLERIPRRDDDNQVDVTISPYARKDSGSYYTPQELVDLIVEQTLTPLVEERIEAFRAEPIEANDPAEAILKLTILDPAMGSGHFLITALDWLTVRLAALVNREWDEAPGYVSPLRARLWDLQEQHSTLADHTLLERMVLKRCIYGVDKNPMAVELAKVALWLHTFTGELPLPYLDHRIIAGDSLLGIRGEDARRYLSEWGRYPLGDSFERNCAEAAVAARASDEVLDLTISQIDESRTHRDDAGLRNRRHRTPLNLVTGLRWLSAGMKKRERAEFHAPLLEILSGHSGRAISVLFNGENDEGLTPTTRAYREIRDRANEVAARERILHWEIEFPHVMTGENPGFDAIVSNPPWDRIEQQEREWFAIRDPAIANLAPASRRKAAIERGIAAGDELCVRYDEVRSAAHAMRVVCRASGGYPLLSGGRTNLYSLFVERSLALVRPQGVVGLLTPSGIYADHTAAKFFRSISTTGRLGGIYDFENRRSSNAEARTAKWFADVHPQFKFTVLIVGGRSREFEDAQCGFFLNGKADLGDADRVFPLRPADFTRINPNTGTAPILRSRRDAEIVARIYRDHPVLVDHSHVNVRKLWPVRFVQGLFNMTSDSGLFETAEALEAVGAYRVAGHRYKRGDDMWVPLYQGRMIHHFDHRANSVGYNPASEHNPYVSEPVTDEEKANPGHFPRSQYWVAAHEVARKLPQNNRWTVAFRDIARSTDERTMIAAVAPRAAYGHKVPLLLPDPTLSAGAAACVVANLDSIALDYVARCKLPGTSMTWYIVEQLPMIAPDDFDRPFGDTTARELVKDHVLRLCYTAWDLQPFARDLGYEGDPFIWNPAERRQLRARLDALFFHLYGLDEDDAAYILDQFPVLEKNERREHGRYLTKELVLGHYRALAAGDTTAVIAESTID